MSLSNRAHYAVIAGALLACTVAGQARADERPPAADTYATDVPGDTFEVDGSTALAPEIVAYLEAHYQATLFLRWHSVERWRPMAACESGERWDLNASHDGGVQFSPRTWRAMGGTEFAPYAYQAQPWEQVVVADRLVAYEQALGRGGWGPWPSCARQLGLPR